MADDIYDKRLSYDSPNANWRVEIKVKGGSGKVTQTYYFETKALALEYARQGHKDFPHESYRVVENTNKYFAARYRIF